MNRVLPKGEFAIGSRLFLTGIGFVYIIAFGSLWLQIDGLFGSEGIMPMQRYFDRFASQGNALGYILRYPSLLWLNLSLEFGDSLLHLLCSGGVVVGGLALFNYYRGISLLICWIFYLSLVSMGSPFLSFQWDNLLLECGFLAIWLTGFKKLDSKPSPFILLLIFLLIFRLMFFSGYVKLASDDPVWWDLSALSLHFETQPLPHALSWYFHQLPTLVLKLCTGIMFFIELIAPFFIFLSRRLRHTAALLFIVLMLLISASGNYTFFNLLTVFLCLLLFDDSFYQRRVAENWLGFLPKQKFDNSGRAALLIQKVVCIILVVLALAVESRRWLPLQQIPLLSQLVSYTRPFRSVNTYGLFADMTTNRPEVIFEISPDGENWEELQFKYKPVSLNARPGWVQPHQPRLDWQLWFAGLYYQRVISFFHQQYSREPNTYNEIHRFIFQRFRQVYYRHKWVHNFMEGILQNNPEILKLTAHKKLPDKPFYIRAWLYDYQFAEGGESNWWQRENKRLLFPAFGLEGV